mmetsp:Transcript_63690/g.121407  ORF Transcript_63690/g.121407 Transcript_63690/m.121407 type:complete len:245 (-) Transcript_63690:810-1544(-)
MPNNAQNSHCVSAKALSCTIFIAEGLARRRSMRSRAAGSSSDRTANSIRLVGAVRRPQYFVKASRNGQGVGKGFLTALSELRCSNVMQQSRSPMSPGLTASLRPRSAIMSAMSVGLFSGKTSRLPASLYSVRPVQWLTLSSTCTVEEPSSMHLDLRSSVMLVTRAASAWKNHLAVASAGCPLGSAGRPARLAAILNIGSLPPSYSSSLLGATASNSCSSVARKLFFHVWKSCTISSLASPMPRA